MSRLYETLRRMELQKGKSDGTRAAALAPVDLVQDLIAEPSELNHIAIAEVHIATKTRLVALSDPRGLAAEKFRALVVRLEHLRKQQQLKSLQITSAVGKEGKTLVAGNLAVVLARHTGSRVLIVEGDLHLPKLASLFGLTELLGVGEWWSAREEKERITQYIYRLNEIPLWFLGAGALREAPAQILQSARFAETFVRLTTSFDWVVVDSPPILPLVDANLWSRLVEGTILVVREGVTPISSLKKSFDALDSPKLVGLVLNEASELDRTNYSDQYYALRRQ